MSETQAWILIVQDRDTEIAALKAEVERLKSDLKVEKSVANDAMTRSVAAWEEITRLRGTGGGDA